MGLIALGQAYLDRDIARHDAVQRAAVAKVEAVDECERIARENAGAIIELSTRQDDRQDERIRVDERTEDRLRELERRHRIRTDVEPERVAVVIAPEPPAPPPPDALNELKRSLREPEPKRSKAARVMEQSKLYLGGE